MKNLLRSSRSSSKAPRALASLALAVLGVAFLLCSSRSKFSLDELHRWLPPDAREDAPELVRFRALRAQGVHPQQAEEQCWLEFGMANCRQALQRFWDRQDEPRPAWTTHHYLELVSRYRRSFESGRPCIPMLVLPRAGSVTGHELHWVSDSTPPMRHTCA